MDGRNFRSFVTSRSACSRLATEALSLDTLYSQPVASTAMPKRTPSPRNSEPVASALSLHKQ